MSRRSDKQLLLDMMEATERVLTYTKGTDEAKFLADPILIDAVVRNIQVIGEAAFRISKEFKAVTPEMEWSRFTGMRHRLVHDYFEIEERLVWLVVTEKLPTFKAELEAVLEKATD